METIMASMISRRQVMLGLGGAACATFIGANDAFGAKPALPKLVMHRNEGCGCCLKWADAARKAGFTVDVVNEDDLMAFKRTAGVPRSVMSCHTTMAGNYVIEGHVPLDAVKKVLASKPKLRGIAVPGMPLGAPGMEVPSGEKQPFDVLSFDAAMNVGVFAKY